MNHLGAILITSIISILVGYKTMMVLIDKNVTDNINKLYSAIYMVLWMVLIMLLYMVVCNKKGKPTYYIIIGGVVIGIIILNRVIKNQVGINQREFLKSMIEHHQMAVTMSERLREKPHDADVDKLLDDIISSQNKEIDFMKHKLF
jgi:hypothetical protein